MLPSAVVVSAAPFRQSSALFLRRPAHALRNKLLLMLQMVLSVFVYLSFHEASEGSGQKIPLPGGNECICVSVLCLLSMCWYFQLCFAHCTSFPFMLFVTADASCHLLHI